MLQRIIGLARRAIDDYNMIEDGDKIAIGLSGGKDSIVLLQSLYYLRKFYPKKFDILAITINPGKDTLNTTELKKMCQNLNIEYIVQDSDIFEIVMDIRKEKSPCSLCANLRRGMLCSVATEHGCNKLALGHNKDDVMETLLMSLFLNGNIHTFAPMSNLTRSNLMLIRPLIYVDEKMIRITANHNNYPVVKKSCPYDGTTKRE